MPAKRPAPPTQHVPEGEPKTVRELRARLEALGNPWEVHSALSDDDPLPQPSRGGMEEEKPSDTFGSTDEMRAALKESPPTNPFLQQVWIDAGWMSKKQAHGIVGSTNQPPAAMDTATPPRPRGSRAKARREKS